MLAREPVDCRDARIWKTLRRGRRAGEVIGAARNVQAWGVERQLLDLNEISATCRVRPERHPHGT
jgi:hypothetical protein